MYLTNPVLQISQISAGLAYLHSKDVIHGDVKGANVLISPALTAQLCDFGLSKFADTATSTGGKGGSLPWLSPERMDRPDSPRTKESDVYAFGMTIYEVSNSSDKYSSSIKFETLVRYSDSVWPHTIHYIGHRCITDCHMHSR